MSSRSMRICAPLRGCPSGALTSPSIAEICANAAPANTIEQTISPEIRGFANIRGFLQQECCLLQNSRAAQISSRLQARRCTLLLPLNALPQGLAETEKPAVEFLAVHERRVERRAAAVRNGQAPEAGFTRSGDRELLQDARRDLYWPADAG